MKQVPSSQCLAYLRSALGLAPSKEAYKVSGRSSCRRKYSSRSLYVTGDQTLISSASWRPSPISIHDHPRKAAQPGLRHPSPVKLDVNVGGSRDLLRSPLSTRLSEYYATGAYEDLITEYETHCGTGIGTNADDLNLYLESLAKLSRHTTVMQAADRFLADPYAATYNVRTANILLQYFVNCNHSAKALAFLSTLRELKFKLDSTAWTTLIEGSRNGSGSINQLNKVLHAMLLDRVPKTATIYNSLIRAHQDFKLFDQARMWFSEAVRKRQANLTTFHIAIESELQRNQWSNAWQLLQMMKTSGVGRDESVYLLFLLKMLKHGNSSQMENLLVSMQSDGVRFSSRQFHAILRRASEVTGSLGLASILELATKYGVDMNRQTHDIIWKYYHSPSISTLSESSHNAICSIILNDFHCVGGTPAATFVQNLSIARQKDHANKPPQPALPLQRSNNAASFKVESRRIDSLLKSGDWQEALKLYSDIRSLGINPPMNIVVKVLAGLLRNRQYSKSKELVASLDNVEVLRHNMHFQTTMLRLISTSTVIEDIHKTIRFLESIGASLDIIFYSAAAWRLYRDNRFREAIALLRYAFGLGLAFDLVVWMILIECYAKTRDLASTIWCLQTMKDNKIKLDSQARRRIKRVIKTGETADNRSEVIAARELFEDIRRAQNVGKAGEQSQPVGNAFIEHEEEEEDRHLRLASV